MPLVSFCKKTKFATPFMSVMSDYNHIVMWIAFDMFKLHPTFHGENFNVDSCLASI